MGKYRKKPVVIEAVRWTGDNWTEMREFIGGDIVSWQHGGVGEEPSLWIKTLEGTMKAKKGDYVIRGVAGEFYPCDALIFAETYEIYEPTVVEDTFLSDDYNLYTKPHRG